ncbi:hypothetical protein ACIA49_06890 [Kribbella sp. NPDC051587]|uniref:hypothetical protein n=1 Tax=Kribbella sp. NPDC051587 TaxID=3364119 RepID=UPI003797695D
MSYIPFSFVKSIHEEMHSAAPDAPIRLHKPKRRLLTNAVRRLLDRPDRVGGEVCQAEACDRGTTAAGPARAC